uniref:ABC transporter permease n=1 Tax=Mycolicibacterium smegmatis TaxID=1772 RepID=O87312_MYCSM|nr:unknown [Mycolicibacterium smegmatis MC2 155]
MADTTRTDLSWTGVRVLRRTVSRNLQVAHVRYDAHRPAPAVRGVGTGSDRHHRRPRGRDRQRRTILRWIAVLAALFVVLTVVYRFGARLLMFAIARESHLLRVESSAKILDPLGIETDYKVGELLSISSDDADEVSYLLDYVPRIVGAVVGTVVCGAVLLSIHLPLGLMVLIGVPVVVFGLQLTAPMIARRVEDQQAEIGRATAWPPTSSADSAVAGIGAQANAAARYRVASRRALTATLRAARIQSIHSGAAAAAGALAAMAVAVVAAYFAIRGSMTVGQLITVIGLAQFLIEPFSLLAVVPSWVAEARASANRVARVLSAPTRHSPVFAADPRDAAARLSVRNATHAGLKNLSFDVEPGEFVAVLTSDVRDAGALIDLLSGYQRAEDKGTVLVGGRRLDQIPLKERREHLLVEHHLSSLFSGTLETNLNVTGTDPRRGRVSVDDALQASCAVDVVDLHPDGLAHAVVERGASLSGGQRQRWTLARALLADPAVLVLHDPTTAIDTVTEQVIADGIRRLRTRAGRTTVVLTSSPALLAAADRVLLVIDGRLDSEGTHRDLVDAHSDYRDLVTR